MPFDGVLPGSPPERLLEADHRLTQERRASAKLRRKPLSAWEVQARRAALAREAIAVLDKPLTLFADGENWIQGDFENRGGHCLLGGLQHIRRARRRAGDRAGRYLSRAIAKVYAEPETIIHFNDNQPSYAEIRAVVLRARKLAQRVMDGRAGESMPFDGESETGKGVVRFDHDPEAVEHAFKKSARETIAALDHLAALFDGGRHWIRKKECDEKGRFCLRGGVTHIASKHPGRNAGYYLRLAIREFVGRSMTIPAFNDSAPSFASIAYVIARARELAVADSEKQP